MIWHELVSSWHMSSSDSTICTCWRGLLTWSSICLCWHGLPHVHADMVFHVSLLTWSTDIDILDLTIIVCSPDPMVLIHFGFSGFKVFKSQTKISEVRFSRSLTSSHIYTWTKWFSSIMILDRWLDLSAMQLFYIILSFHLEWSNGWRKFTFW